MGPLSRAPLLAQGLSQQAAIDYLERLSPTGKQPTLKILLTIALASNWVISQLDLKNAFLHRLLQEEGYMKEPQGVVDTTRPNHLCRLKGAIYGLKQDPRACFHRYSTFLLSLAFTGSTADNSMFIHKSSSGLIVLLLYVDDIILTGSIRPLFQLSFQNYLTVWL